MANLAPNFTLRAYEGYLQASNRAITSITWQAGCNGRVMMTTILDHIARRGTRGLPSLYNTIRHEMITYDDALDAVPANSRQGRYDRVHEEVTDAVRQAIFQVIVTFIDRSNVRVIDRQADIIQQQAENAAELARINEVQASMLQTAFNAIEGLLTAPGVDETSADWQAAYAQYEQLAEQL